MTQEALKLALEALELCNGAETVEGVVIYTNKEITAIKEALAQTQEPVGRFTGKFTVDAHDRMLCEVVCTGAIPTAGAALYTTPPQRTWVGLTIKDVKVIEDNAPSKQMAIFMADATLKEKNT